MKFLPKPKSAFDFAWLLMVMKKINALLNGKIISKNGAQVGQILYADGNTVWVIDGGDGWRWANPIEVDPTKSYAKEEVINVQATHALVTAGMHDLADGVLRYSCPGRWVAIRPVPAQVTVSGVIKWNLPQYPLPVPTNYDDPTNFWDYLGEPGTCPGA